MRKYIGPVLVILVFVLCMGAVEYMDSRAPAGIPLVQWNLVVETGGGQEYVIDEFRGPGAFGDCWEAMNANSKYQSGVSCEKTVVVPR